jgi:hypothetical protein
MPDRENGAPLNLTALAGPVAQAIFVELSLGSHADGLRDSILDCAKELMGDQRDLRILLDSNWGSDLQSNSQIIQSATSSQRGTHHLNPRKYPFDEEAALRVFFRVPEVGALVREQAQKLAAETRLDAQELIRRARAADPPTGDRHASDLHERWRCRRRVSGAVLRGKTLYRNSLPPWWALEVLPT